MDEKPCLASLKEEHRWMASQNRMLTRICRATLDRGHKRRHNAEQVRINKQSWWNLLKNCPICTQQKNQTYLYHCIILCILENICFCCCINIEISKNIVQTVAKFLPISKTVTCLKMELVSRGVENHWSAETRPFLTLGH
jgi:hypothetical protein